jgi:hypothetical protein
MKQVAIQPVGAEARQRSFAGGQGAVFGCITGQHFGHQENLVPPSLDGLADNSFRGAGSVHFRGVDVRKAKIEAASQRCDGAGGGRCLNFPNSLPDAGDLSPCRAEGAGGAFGGHVGFGVLQETGAQSPRNREA